MKQRSQVGIGFIMLSLLAVVGSANATGLTPRYVSPRPGAMFVSPSTTIVIRPGDSLVASSLSRALFVITGSKSHTHAGRVVLSDDARTVIFKPDQPFVNREQVTVTLKPGLVTTAGHSLGGFSFHFTIRADHRVLTSALSDRSAHGADDATVDDPLYNQSPAIALNAAANTPSANRMPEGLPVGFPAVTVTTNDSPSDGALFLSNFQTTTLFGAEPNFLMIVANDGSPVWYRQVDSASMDFKVQPNGLLTYFDAARHIFYGLDSMYNLVDSFQCDQGYATDVHDLLVLPNGHALLFGLDTEIVDMTQYIAGANTQAIVIGVVVEELDKSKNAVFLWNGFDHYNVTDATHENLTAQVIDYVHANSLDIDSAGNLLVSCRHLDEVTKIDRETGDIIWRLGGANNQFTFINDTLGFSHQHCVRWISGTNITLFDNGNFHTPRYSRACEYKLDQVAKTCELVWQYTNTPAVYNGAMGSVQRLPNGNTLIGWGLVNKPELTEVRPDGTKALEMSLSNPAVSYRVLRFPWVSKVAAAVATHAAVGASLGMQTYPNPSASTATLVYDLSTTGAVRLAVYDVTGRQVSLIKDGVGSVGEHHVTIPTSQLSNGVYFCRLSTVQGTIEQRLVVAH